MERVEINLKTLETWPDLVLPRKPIELEPGRQHFTTKLSSEKQNNAVTTVDYKQDPRAPRQRRVTGNPKSSYQEASNELNSIDIGELTAFTLEELGVVRLIQKCTEKSIHIKDNFFDLTPDEVMNILLELKFDLEHVRGILYLPEVSVEIFTMFHQIIFAHANRI